MVQVIRSETFRKWFDKLADDRAFAKIAQRLERLAEGNPGDVKPVGEGVSEMRITHGPGYRIYYVTVGAEIILCAGTKATQAADIAAAKRIAREWRKEPK